MSNKNEVLENLYAEFEKLKTEAKERQDRAREIKKEMIGYMEEQGYDEVLISGLDDSVVQLSLTYPEREVLNKKGLSEALNMTQKDLSKPYVMIKLTEEGKISSELIEKFTEIEERQQFSAKEYQEDQDD